VIGILGIVEIREVAGGTCGRRALELAINVTLVADRGEVCTGERILGGGTVIELGTLPLARVVTHRAILWKSRGGVVGVLGVAVIGQVTGKTGARQAGVLVIDVALPAGYRQVCPIERKLSFIVVKLPTLPLCGVVAVGAIL